VRVAAAALLATLIGSTAHAEPEQRETPRTQALLAEGRKLDDLGNYEGACAAFLEAISAAPESVNTMLGLGSCHEHLRKFATALMWFRRAKLAARKHGLTTSAEKASGRAEALEAHTPVLKITFGETRPKDVKVTIDGSVVAPESFKHVELDPGHHKLEASARGFQTFREELDIEDGELRTIVVPFGANGETRDTRDPRDIRVTRDMNEDQPRPTANAQRTKMGIGLAAGGGAAFIAGAAIALYARSKYNQCVDSDGIARPMCLGGQDGYLAANHYRNLARWAATPLVLGGAAAVGVGLYLYFTARSDSRTVAWAPMVGANELGIAALGRF
jgi:tetratricopeptide (TPR) repeat protein